MSRGQDTYLAARTVVGDLGIGASSVRRVIAREEWDGPSPVDLDRLTSETSQDPNPETVLVVDGAGGPCAFSTTRPLVVRTLPRTEIHELPAVLWQRGLAPTFLHVAREPGAPPLLILNHGALASDLVAEPSQGTDP